VCTGVPQLLMASKQKIDRIAQRVEALGRPHLRVPHLGVIYPALDVKSTGEAADPNDLRTRRVPLAGLRPKAGCCAIFGQYSFVLDIAIGTDPPRLSRLPAKSRAVSCVVLQHANISYASLWQDGREIWQARHQPSKEQPENLDFWGDLPPRFFGTWEAALQEQREGNARRKPANGVWTTYSTCRSMQLLR
jgi:hypothetical protein